MIFEILPRGAENAITARDLLKLSGMPSGAALRHQIALERRTGSLILSTCRGKRRGYFCPSNDPATAQDELVRSALSYISTGETPEFSDRDSRLAWTFMRPVIDSDQRRYYDRIRAAHTHLETSAEASDDE